MKQFGLAFGEWQHPARMPGIDRPQENVPVLCTKAAENLFAGFDGPAQSLFIQRGERFPESCFEMLPVVESASLIMIPNVSLAGYLHALLKRKLDVIKVRREDVMVTLHEERHLDLFALERVLPPGREAEHRVYEQARLAGDARVLLE